jgi:hypothetical protein
VVLCIPTSSRIVNLTIIDQLTVLVVNLNFSAKIPRLRFRIGACDIIPGLDPFLLVDGLEQEPSVPTA